MPSDVSTLHLHLHPSIEYLPSLAFPAPAGQMSQSQAGIQSGAMQHDESHPPSLFSFPIAA